MKNILYELYVKRLSHFFFILSITFLSLILSFNIVEISYGQNNIETESETAITSYLDALIKDLPIDFPSFSSWSQFCTFLFIYSDYEKRTNNIVQ